MNVADPLLHYKLDAEYFDYFEPPNRIEGDCARRIQEAVAAEMKDLGGITIDLGSGGGWLQHRTQRGGVRIVSVDLSLQNLRRIHAGAPEALCVVADAQRLPFRNGAFRTAVASEILEHLNDPQAAANELRRTLEPNGSVIVSTPYKEKLRHALCIHCNQPTPLNAHLHSFDAPALRSLLRNARFADVRHVLLLGKIFSRSRASYLLRFLPYAIWKRIDACFIALFHDAQTIVLTAHPDMQEPS